MNVGIEIQDKHISYLAETFQVAESTVKRWRSGIARPHPVMLVKILKEIEKLEDEERVDDED